MFWQRKKKKISFASYFFLYFLHVVNSHQPHPVTSGLKIPRQIDDQDIVLAAEFAMGELMKLSDSGIYRTLALEKIENAAYQEGIYHSNIFLNLSISSPHYASGKNVEVFELIVMRHLEDNSLSFAINEFPSMNEDAIEQFWIEMVEEHRKKRQSLFDAWDMDFIEEEKKQNISYKNMATFKLRDLLLSRSTRALDKEIIQQILDERMDTLIQQEASLAFSKDEL